MLLSDESTPASIERSRLAGERTIGWFRLALILVTGVVAVGYAVYTGTLGTAAVRLTTIAAVHLVFSLGTLWFLRRRARTDRVGYVAPLVDVVLAVLAMAVYATGSGGEGRPDLVRGFAPLLFVLFNLLSIGRHNPANCLYTGGLSLAALVVLRVTTGGLFAGDALGAVLGYGMVAGSCVAAWRVSLGGLRLAERTARTERALEREQAYQFRLFESTPEAVVQLSPDGEVIRVNAAFSRLFGYEQGEAAGRYIDDLIIPDLLRDEATRYSEQAARGQALHVETVRRRKDGGLVDVSIIGAPVFLEGRQVGIFGVYRDISERRRRERLFEAVNRAALWMLLATTDDDAFRAVADELEALGLSCALFQVSRSKPDTLRLTNLRGSFGLVERVEEIAGRSVMGIEVSSAPGTVYGGLLASPEPILSAIRYEDLLQALPVGDPARAERLRQVLADHPAVYVRLPGDTSPTGLLMVIGAGLGRADVSAMGAFGHQLAAALSKVSLIRQLEGNLEELRQTQAQLLQAQKLEAVGRLAGGVAHDFNNLLTIITGYGEIVRESLPSSDSRRADVEEILRAATRAAEVTRQLLAFSRRQVLRVELVDPNAVVEGMRNALLRLLGEDITLEVESQSGLPRVRGDATQMAQALLNIALNARDAMQGGGTLTVRTTVVEGDGLLVQEHPEIQPRTYVSISISDTGPGIPPDALPHIFEPFFTTKEAGRGTGLGLAMVYGFVKQSGGYVYADNLPGGGARFRVLIPAANEPAAELTAGAAGEPELATAGGSEGVLVVEDEEPVLAFTCAVLERAGYRVVARSVPGEAATLGDAVLAGIELLVTDVVMPGMNGRALAEELTMRRPGLKVLYVSGYADEVFSRIGMFGAGVTHLQKPYTPAELLRRVRETLDGRAPG